MKPFRDFAAVLFIATVVTTPSLAAQVMSEKQARVAAAKILKGDPYGNSFDQVMKNVEEAQLITGGSICGARVTKPLWQFRIVVVKERNPAGDSAIRGPLVIDGRTGELVCAGLPFLD